MGQLFTPIAVPLAAMAIGITFGMVFAIPKRSTGALAAAGWAVSSGAAVWIIAMSDYQQLASFPLFTDFSQLIRNSQYSKLVLGDFENTTVAALIGLYEVGLMLGFAALSGGKKKATVSEQIAKPAAIASKVEPFMQANGKGGNQVTELIFPKEKDNSPPFRDVISNQSTDSVNPHSLDRDERTIVELFLFGKTTRIVPHVDVSKPEGYYFEGASSLKLDTTRLTKLLDSLAKRNILVAEIEDKLLVCRECGSPSLQLRSMCPECKSMQLSKHNILEHFACGLIDKQESFRTPSGDLVCPKCNGKLHLIGSDYRFLSQMYICSECRALNKDLLQLMKCSGCGTTSQVGEESEQYLYAYSLNEAAVAWLGDQIKPVEACSAYFRSLGCVVVAPAFVSGKSGTQHTFDMLVLDSSHRALRSEGDQAYASRDSGGTAIEILVSSRTVELAEMTRVYGKMCDVECNAMIFAAPSLSDDARHYAEQFKIKVIEGSSIEEALKRSQLTYFATEQTRPKDGISI